MIAPSFISQPSTFPTVSRHRISCRPSALKSPVPTIVLDGTEGRIVEDITSSPSIRHSTLAPPACRQTRPYPSEVGLARFALSA